VERYVRSCIAEDVRVEDLKLLQFQQLRALGVCRVVSSSGWLPLLIHQVRFLTTTADMLGRCLLGTLLFG
jgi:hypothetical protein